MRHLGILGTSGSLLMLAAPAQAQLRCPPPLPNEWLVAAPSNFDGDEVSGGLVHKVTSRVGTAISLLAKRSARRINHAQVHSFIGNKPTNTRGLQPYLIRAVDAGADVSVIVKGDAVEVFTGNLGCHAHVKTPIVVYLRQPPRQVFVETRSAL